MSRRVRRRWVVHAVLLWTASCHGMCGQRASSTEGDAEDAAAGGGKPLVDPPSSYRLLSPATSSMVASSVVVLRWRGDGEATVELASSPSFTVPQRLRGKTEAVARGLSPGRYFWRVRHGSRTTATWSFRVLAGGALPVRQGTLAASNFNGDRFDDFLLSRGAQVGPIVDALRTIDLPSAGDACPMEGDRCFHPYGPSEVGDMDGDGFDDAWIVYRHGATRGFRVFHHPGASRLTSPWKGERFELSTEHGGSGHPRPHVVRLGDIDGDGLAEVGWVEVTHRDDVPIHGAMRVFHRTSEGQLSQLGEPLPAYQQIAAAGDLDADGRHDLVGGDDEGRVFVHLGRPEGLNPVPDHTFRAPANKSLDLQLADVNRDGRADIVGTSGTTPSSKQPSQRTIWVALTQPSLTSTQIDHTLAWTWKTPAQQCGSESLRIGAFFGDHDTKATWLAAGSDDNGCGETAGASLVFFGFDTTRGLWRVSGPTAGALPITNIDPVGDCNGDGWDDVLVREESVLPANPAASLFFGHSHGIAAERDRLLAYDDDPAFDLELMVEETSASGARRTRP